jgi:Dynein heavy chain, N-terminal region 2
VLAFKSSTSQSKPAGRAWHAQATGKFFTMDVNFALGDLVRLQLHSHIDACTEIVDRAHKELTIEKALQRIDDTWSRLRLSFAKHQVLFAGLGGRHYISCHWAIDLGHQATSKVVYPSITWL